jgi:exopolysaccharide production protein ExoQ
VPRVIEKALIVFALLYFAGGYSLILQPENRGDEGPPAGNSAVAMLHIKAKSSMDPTEKNPLNLAIQIVIYLGMLVLIAQHLGPYLDVARKNKLLWILLGYALASTLWSPVAGFTLRRSLVLIASTGFGVYLGTRYTMRQIMQFLCVVGALAVIASYLVILFRPQYGIAVGVNAGAWQGIFGQKNVLGRFTSLETLVFIIAAFQDRTQRWVYLLGALLCAGLLAKSQDVTAYLILPLTLALIPVFQYARKHSLVRSFALLSVTTAILGTFVLMILTSPDKLLMSLGKDSSLSGRTKIWSMVWEKILQHPLLGHGYSGFWLGWNGQDSTDIWRALRWAVPHSHNGFLDVLAELGFAGLFIFFLGYVVCFRQALRCARASKTLLGLFPLLYFTFLILFNLSEASILKQESMFWVLYVACWILTTRWLELAATASASTTPSSRRVGELVPVVA